MNTLLQPEAVSHDVGAAAAALNGVLSGTVRVAEPLGRYTTLRVGGPADLFVTVESEAELAGVLEIASRYELPVTPLGGGSNVIVLDGGIRGIVLQLGRGFNYCEVEGCTVRAGAQTPLAQVVHRSARHNLTGLEFACGIPGCVGGAVASNAGTGNQAVADRLTAIRVMDSDGVAAWQPRSDFRFAYRSSDLRERGLVVLGAEFELAIGDGATVRDTINRLLNYRAETQPLTQANAGCMFKNPEGGHAGKLIDAAGLKGLRVGDAVVSDVHANFVINLGHATSCDVLELVRQVQERVAARHGIRLQMEVRVLGDPA